MADSAVNKPTEEPSLPAESASATSPSKPPPPSKALFLPCCPPTTTATDTHPVAPLPPPTITVSSPDGPPQPEPKKGTPGFREKYKRNREDRDSKNEPQPWIVQKLTIFFLVGLWGLATYVYTGRICVPMIRKDPDALGSRTLGILFLVVFYLLWLIFGWSYVKIVLTPPGYARDVIRHIQEPATVTVAGPAYSTANSTASERQSAPYRHGETRHWDIPDEYNSETDSVSPYDSDFLDDSAQDHSPRRLEPPTPNTGRFGSSLGPPLSSHVNNSSHSSDLPPVLHSRQPPRHATLAPEFRRCQREGFVKPLRAHHCRLCATCILNYDHHCPWIGQCVGARNRKFFVIFVFWSMLFTLWTAITLVIVVARASLRNQNIDALSIVIIALSSLFAVFTASLLSTHLWLISLNLTTVEHYGIQTMERREEATLDQMFPWWRLRARRHTIRQWDEEWGALSTEANIWWLGSRLANWEATMGKNKVTWFLPIGKCEGDGVNYPTNPRFDTEGRWRRRPQWPAELQ